MSCILSPELRRYIRRSARRIVNDVEQEDSEPLATGRVSRPRNTFLDHGVHLQAKGHVSMPYVLVAYVLAAAPVRA